MEHKNEDNNFLPEGAIGFFSLLLLMGFLLFAGIYLIYIMRL